MMSPCPTCGYPLERPPSDSDICPSCGTQFGYSDSGRSYSQLREIWVRRGAPWHSRVHVPPRNWNPWWQLIQAGYEYAVPFQIELRGRQPGGTQQLIEVIRKQNETPRVVYV